LVNTWPESGDEQEGSKHHLGSAGEGGDKRTGVEKGLERKGLDAVKGWGEKGK